MPRIYAFDNRDGTINNQVRVHRPRTPAQASVEAFKRHPRIDWKADPTPSAPASAVKPAAASWGRIDHRGIRVPTYEEMAAMYPVDGAYEAFVRREHDRA